MHLVHLNCAGMKNFQGLHFIRRLHILTGFKTVTHHIKDILPKSPSSQIVKQNEPSENFTVPLEKNYKNFIS